MNIIYQSNDGLPATLVKISQATLVDNAFEVTLAVRFAGDMPLPGGGVGVSEWTEKVTVPIEVTTNPAGANAGIIGWLTTQGRFVGGQVVSDEDLPFAVKRVQLLRAIRDRREQLRQGIAPTPFGGVNIDSESRDNITGLLKVFELAEKFGQPLESVEFTMANDLDRPFTQLEFEQLSLAVGIYVNDVHRHKRLLQAQVDACTTIEELEAIDITLGWPGEPQPEPETAVEHP